MNAEVHTSNRMSLKVICILIVVSATHKQIMPIVAWKWPMYVPK